MTEDIQQRFQSLNVWSQGDKRALHKPLLVLWSIRRCLLGQPRFAPFHVVEKEFSELWQEFGPYRETGKIRPHYPFWRLQNDDIWEIDRPDRVGKTIKEDALIKDLREHKICGGFREKDYLFLQRNPDVAAQIAASLVSSHFPDTQFDEVLDAILSPSERSGVSILEGIDDLNLELIRRKKRDPKFRRAVLNAYGHQCAVCGFAGEIRGHSVAIEAAHIKWHEAKGPAQVQNGLSLCALHHRLFDRGAFTLIPDLDVVVADVIAGPGVDLMLNRYHGQRLKGLPTNVEHYPDNEFIRWHHHEVFRSPYLLT